MLLKTLKVVNSRGAQLELPLDDISNGFVVKEIQGLGPVKATLVSSSVANMDGEQYRSSRRESRNIIIKLGLDPDYTQNSVFNLRSQLYEFFMPKTKAELYFTLFDMFTENLSEQYLIVKIDGHIETAEPDIFSREPAITISIMCFESDFVNTQEETFSAYTTGTLAQETLTYIGSVETGVVFTLDFSRSADNFIIYGVRPDGTLVHVDISHDFISGDKVEVSSVKGNKFVTLTRNLIKTFLLYELSPQSGWLELYPGDNKIRVQMGGVPDQPYQIRYKNRYGGL
jgi:hypothetical protein